ncbi:MAG: hypothetical protein EG823_01645 [Actinobacteria bacterium]|nr:hypothetical protein [Actinomycetota bacterium]
MIGQIPQLLDVIQQVIADPAGNLTATTFLLAAAVLLVLILLLGGLALLLPAPARKPRKRPTASAAPSAATDGSPKRSPRRAVRVRHWVAGRGGSCVIAAALVAAAAAGYGLTTSDRYCLSCHVGGGAIPSADEQVTVSASEAPADQAHVTVSCVTCHESPADILANIVKRSSDVAAQAGLGRSQYSTSVDSRNCLRCHEQDLVEPLTNDTTGVVMSHREPLDAGWACNDCHLGTGHSPITQPAVMSKCVLCHNAIVASAKCDACHTKDTSAASGLAEGRVFGKAKIARTDCEGCHSMESCDACHGIRMPHSDLFLRTHPRYSGFDKKKLCLEKCHTNQDCYKCHAPWTNHIPSFKQDHKRLPKDAYCNTCHDQHEGPICNLCHDFNQE